MSYHQVSAEDYRREWKHLTGKVSTLTDDQIVAARAAANEKYKGLIVLKWHVLTEMRELENGKPVPSFEEALGDLLGEYASQPTDTLISGLEISLMALREQKAEEESGNDEAP